MKHFLGSTIKADAWLKSQNTAKELKKQSSIL